MTRNSSNPVVDPIPDRPPKRELILYYTMTVADQVTINHKGVKKSTKVEYAERTATHVIPITQQWVTFKRGVEERVQRALNLKECRLEDLNPRFNVKARFGALKWIPCSEEAYNDRFTIWPLPGSHDVHGSITYVPPIIHLPAPSPPPSPSPPTVLLPSLSQSKVKSSISSSREKVATTWSNTQRIKQRIIDDHPPCPQCSMTKHAQARCYVDALGTHLPITTGFLHAWAEAVTTGECGTTIAQLSPRLYDSLYDTENRLPSPSKDQYAVRRRAAAAAAMTPPRGRVLVEQSIPNLSDPPTGSSGSSSFNPPSSGSPAGGFGRGIQAKPRPPHMSIPRLYSLVKSSYNKAVTMLIREGVYDADVLVQWIKQTEANPNASLSRTRYMLQLKSWIEQWEAMPHHHAQTRQQITSDVKGWLSRHAIAIPVDLEDSDTEDEPIPEPGLSQFLCDDDYPDLAAESGQTTLMEPLEESLPLP
ncbi:unnamed protein product [Parajaminaea phylloscopi]